jgi:hypothetical protein
MGFIAYRDKRRVVGVFVRFRAPLQNDNSEGVTAMQYDHPNRTINAFCQKGKVALFCFFHEQRQLSRNTSTNNKHLIYP